MLEKCCLFCHNYFVRVGFPGTYTVSGGTISPCDFLKDGQRFHVVGSDLNDGVYTWHVNGIKNDDDDADAELQDETFIGTILPMAVPKAFIELAEEIALWDEQYGAKALSPFQSESVIGVYSYTKAQASGDAVSGGSSLTWQTAFRSRLLPYMRTGMLL